MPSVDSVRVAARVRAFNQVSEFFKCLTEKEFKKLEFIFNFFINIL